MRADALDGLSESGWAALVEHGVRTVVDLRNEDERRPDRAPRPRAVTTLHLPLDGVEDTEFWEEWGGGPQFGTPLYYGPHLERMPERTVAVVRAIATAAPGGVAVHCTRGRDRTGQVSLVALALAGVSPEAIAADYELSAARLSAAWDARGEEDQEPAIAAFLERERTSARHAILALLGSVDIAASLCAAGLGEDELAALRARLVE